MGFWSSVGSAFSSACSAVGGAISSAFGSVTSTFSNAINNIGSVLSTASTILSALSVAMPQLAKIAAILDIALTILNLQGQDENIEEIGEKVLEGYELDIKPADFSSYDEYIAVIRNIKLDPEKSDKFNLGEKLAAGITVQSWGMEEKYGKGSSDFLVHILNDASKIEKGEGYFTEGRVQNILEKIKDVADVAKYFSNKLNPDDSNTVAKQLVAVEQELNPDKSTREIYQELEQHRKD